PVPRVPSRPLAPTSRSLPRAGGQTQQQAPTQKPGTEPGTSKGKGSRGSSAGSRPASQPIPARAGPARPKSPVGTSTRQPAARSGSRRPRRLFLILGLREPLLAAGCHVLVPTEIG